MELKLTPVCEILAEVCFSNVQITFIKCFLLIPRINIAFWTDESKKKYINVIKKTFTKYL